MSQTSRAILARSAASRPQRSWAMPPCQAAGLSVRAAQGGMRRVTVRAAGSGLAQAAGSLGVDRDELVLWVTIHEITHAVQFSGAPWLRDYLGGMLKEPIEIGRA